LLSKKHLVLAKNEIQAMTTNQSALVGDRPSSVAPLQELMRREARFLATKARVSTFGGTTALKPRGCIGIKPCILADVDRFNRSASRI
jgi:hypothetical protein